MPISDKTIVVCLDIDDTLINFASGEFNGSCDTWRAFLRVTQQACAAKGYSLIVQIITSKPNIDSFVTKVAHALRDFLVCYNYIGENVDYISDNLGRETPYYAMLHEFSKEDRQYQRTLSYVIPQKNKNPKQDYLYVETILPAIHVSTRSSKFAVMRYISNFFNNKIPCQNMFLLDNNIKLEDEIRSIRKHQNPTYQLVSANALEYFSSKSKSIRAEITSAILQNFAKQINKVISPRNIYRNEHLRIFDILADAEPETNKQLGSYDKFVRDIQSITDFGVFGLKARRKYKEIEAFLETIDFQNYLQEATDKFYKKVSRENRNNASSNDSKAWRNLIKRLTTAKRSLYTSTISLQDAKLRFLSECIAAIQQSDATLLRDIYKNSSRFYKLRLLTANDSSYIKYRDKFHSELVYYMGDYEPYERNAQYIKS